MQRQTRQPSNNRPRRVSATRRMLALIGALGLVFALAACDQQDDDSQKQAQKPVAEQGQTPAGKDDEAAISTDVVGDENVQQKDQPNMDADKVPTEPGAEEEAPAPESMPAEDEGPPAQQQSQKKKQDPQQDQSLMSMKGEQIVGRQVMSSGQHSLGKVSDLVVNKQSKQLFAVVKVSDAVPADVTVIAIPLQQLRLAQNKLRANLKPQQVTPDMAYKQDQYQPIQLSVPLQKYAAVGQ